MRQITEVLRLNAQGLSYRQIAQSVGISASTVQSYLERAQRAGLTWPLPDEVERLRWRRGYSRGRRKNSDLDDQSPTGSRCTASANAASTSRCNCCTSNTKQSIRRG